MNWLIHDYEDLRQSIEEQRYVHAILKKNYVREKKDLMEKIFWKWKQETFGGREGAVGQSKLIGLPPARHPRWQIWPPRTVVFDYETSSKICQSSSGRLNETVS